MTLPVISPLSEITIAEGNSVSVIASGGRVETLPYSTTPHKCGGVRHSEEAKPTKTSAAALCKRATAAGGSWRVAIRFPLQCEAWRKPKACKGRADCHALRARNDRRCTSAPDHGQVSCAVPQTPPWRCAPPVSKGVIATGDHLFQDSLRSAAPS